MLENTDTVGYVQMGCCIPQVHTLGSLKAHICANLILCTDKTFLKVCNSIISSLKLSSIPTSKGHPPSVFLQAAFGKLTLLIFVESWDSTGAHLASHITIESLSLLHAHSPLLSL